MNACKKVVDGIAKEYALRRMFFWAESGDPVDAVVVRLFSARVPCSHQLFGLVLGPPTTIDYRKKVVPLF